MLAIQEVAPYLLHRKLISPEVVVRGDLLVIDEARRNSNYKVMSRQGPGYLLKQGIGPNGSAMVAREARIYLSIQARADAQRLRRYLPNCYGYDPETGVLILELLYEAESMGSLRRRHGRCSTALASAVGEALGSLHALPGREKQPSGQERELFYNPPWALAIHRPPLAIFRDISSANLRLIEMIQNTTEFCRLLDELRQGWRMDTLIHFDIKGDNLVVYTPPNGQRKTRVALVDWESARMGDVCWDIASVFSDYLGHWLFSIPITGEEPPERFLEMARYPLESIQPAIRAFWHSYVRCMGMDKAMSMQTLLRSVRYSAVRLLQTGYESLQLSSQLSGNIYGLLQLSLNILQRPLEASVYLLGIPLG